MKRILFFLLLCAIYTASVASSVWQWSLPIPSIVSPETNDHPQAFLWIPESCSQVRAVIVGQHNMSEEPIFEHPAFRRAMSELGFAMVWVTPGISQEWDVKTGVQDAFDDLMTRFAQLTGYTELQFAPIVPIGHSAMATYPWNFAAWNPERTLAVLSVHGDSPQTKLTGYGRANLDWEHRTVEGIPSLMVMGEYEWWEDRLFTAFDYRRSHPDAPLSMLADAGHGHFDNSDALVDYLALFLKKAARYRLSKQMPLDRPATLIPVHATTGYLAERWYRDEKPHYIAAPYAIYKGDPANAFWYFDREMAEATERYYAAVRGKREQYIGYMQQGQLLTFDPKNHARINTRFVPEADGVTFHLKAVYTDTLRTCLSSDHAKGTPTVTRICGPVQVVNDSTFTVRFYRMGLNNPRRTGDIWLMASHPGDKTYKSTVQQITLHIPYPNKEGEAQTIDFPELKDVSRSKAKAGSYYKVDGNALQATSTSGLPVYYYIKEGPAEIVDGQLRFTTIPPRARLPIRVTVVAWQYGRSMEPKVQTAEAVERSFYLLP